jgi:hypothetical protein
MTGMEMTGGGATILMLLVAIPVLLFYWTMPILSAASSVPWADPWFAIRIANASLPPMILHTVVSGGTFFIWNVAPEIFDRFPLFFGLAPLPIAGICCIWAQRRGAKPLKK